jgi:hypothetical protein
MLIYMVTRVSKITDLLVNNIHPSNRHVSRLASEDTLTLRQSLRAEGNTKPILSSGEKKIEPSGEGALGVYKLHEKYILVVFRLRPMAK